MHAHIQDVENALLAMCRRFINNVDIGIFLGFI
jgi:hypothetical protein